MSKKTKQYGSIVLIVVIVAVLGLLGGVGYVVWKNYFSEPVPAVEIEDIPEETTPVDTEETPATTTDTTTSTTTAATEDDDYYHITQWGLKGEYTGSFSVQYEVTETDRVVFKSKDFTSDTGKQCQIASILRQTSINENPVYIHTETELDGVKGKFYTTEGDAIFKHIGDYYYSFSRNAGSCPGENEPQSESVKQSDILSGIRRLFVTLAIQ